MGKKRGTGAGRRTGREMMAVARWEKLGAFWTKGENVASP
jgi:hypothetical protein